MSASIPDLACKELVELVTDYLEERLSPADRARFEAHLSACDGCGTYVAQLREVARSASRVTEESLAPETRDALLAAFRGWKKGGGEP